MLTFNITGTNGTVWTFNATQFKYKKPLNAFVCVKFNGPFNYIAEFKINLTHKISLNKQTKTKKTCQMSSLDRM